MVGGSGGGVRVGGGGTFLGFLGLALLVLYDGFVEVILCEGLDGLLVFLADLGWICDAILFVIAFNELLGDLEEVSDIADCITKGVKTYLFGKPLQIISLELVLVAIHDMLDSGMQL